MGESGGFRVEEGGGGWRGWCTLCLAWLSATVRSTDTARESARRQRPTTPSRLALPRRTHHRCCCCQPHHHHHHHPHPPRAQYLVEAAGGAVLAAGRQVAQLHVQQVHQLDHGAHRGGDVARLQAALGLLRQLAGDGRRRLPGFDLNGRAGGRRGE